MSAIIAAFLCIQQVSAQVPGFGRCPRTAAITNFNVQRYLGLWYEIRSYPAIFQAFGACTQAEYSMLPNNTVLVNNTMLQFSRPNNIVGNAQLPEPLVGELIVNFPSTGGPGENKTLHMRFSEDLFFIDYLIQLQQRQTTLFLVLTMIITLLCTHALKLEDSSTFNLHGFCREIEH